MRQDMNGAPALSPWPYLSAYPPIKVRLIARRAGGGGRQAITNEEIAITGGFTLERVEEISRMENWEDVTLSELKRFCAACRFDPLLSRDRRRFEDYENKCIMRTSKPFQWLLKSPVFTTEFQPLIQQLAKMNQGHSQAQHVA